MCQDISYLNMDLKSEPPNYGAGAVQWPSMSFTGRLLLAIKARHCVRIQHLYCQSCIDIVKQK